MLNRWIHKKTDDFLMELERGPDGNLYLHIQVYKWTPRVYRVLMREWLNMEEILKNVEESIIYGILPSKNEEFALMFGWSIRDRKKGLTLVSKEIV